MVQLLDDPGLPKTSSQLVIAAIAYFILPSDAIPEDKYGPIGYLDDIFLCASIADRIVKETGSEEIIKKNWEGDIPIITLVEEILDREEELVGDKKDLIMRYISDDNDK